MTEPFWGHSDSNVRWCERDYAVSPYVAEWWNSITSVFLIVLGVVGARLCMKYGIRRPRFYWAFMIIAITGVGSTMFHATNRYWAQVLDELPMLYGNLIFTLNIVESNHRQARYPWLTNVLWAAGVAITIVYLFFPSFYSMFLSTYSLIVVALTVVSFKRVYCQSWPLDASTVTGAAALRRCRILVITSLVFYGVGVIMWATENTLCPPFHAHTRPPVDPSIVGALNKIQLHALWHITAGIGTYMFVQFQVALHAAAALRTLPSIHGLGSSLSRPTVDPNEDTKMAAATASVNNTSWQFPHVRIPSCEVAAVAANGQSDAKQS